MNAAEICFLVVAGVGAGLTGTVAGLASLVSYPALLLVGLPPVAANVTNTVALTGTTVGAVAGSRPDLRGQRRAVLTLSLVTAAGGAVGGALLLITPAAAVAQVVPWLIAAASVLVVLGPHLRAAARPRPQTRGTGVAVGVLAAVVGVYGGFFGAAAGVIMLALLSTVWAESFARTNAAKNVVTGAANLVAALLFAAVGPVSWVAAAALGAGSVVGARIGPALVRRLPAAPLRVGVCVCGLGLAAWLAWRPAG